MSQRSRSRKGAPGIVEVAKRASVSPATVSRFYNSPAVVKLLTRQRIEKAAAELGYIRDRMAGSMHKRSSGTFGLVVPTINNAIFSELIETFANQLQQHDRTMLIASHNYDLEQEIAIIRSLLERRIDGIAIVGQDHRKVALDMLATRDVPVVALWGYQENTQLHFIGSDNADAARKVTEHLLSMNHRDIAFVFPETQNNDRARDRKLGALNAMQQAGIAVNPDRILTCSYNISESKALASTMLQSKNPPTAVVCGNDIIAHGVIYAGLALGLSLPQQLSVVGIGDFTGSAEIYPSLTTVRLPAKRMGVMAADALMQMADSSAPMESIGMVLETQLIVRESTSVLRNH